MFDFLLHNINFHRKGKKKSKRRSDEIYKHFTRATWTCMTALFFSLLAVDITSDIWHNRAPDNNVTTKIRDIQYTTSRCHNTTSRHHKQVQNVTTTTRWHLANISTGRHTISPAVLRIVKLSRR